MTKENKEILLKDLCARLPYGVKCDWNGKAYELVEIDIKRGLAYIFRYDWFEPTSLPYSIPSGDEIKPYLRPMSSMTKEEFSEVKRLFGFEITTSLGKIYIDDWKQGLNEINYTIDLIDWLNTHHLDYRGLIKKGLALEAPDGMYNF